VNPRWNILIPTIGQRNDRFLTLLKDLLLQTEPMDGAVHVTALWNNGERPLSTVRQSLVDDAVGDYISFVDDDDQLPSYYVSKVFPLLDGVDQIGWRMQCIQDGISLKPTFHSVCYPQWSEDDHGYYRDVSHLNPIRIELAREADFRRGEPPEDVSWANQMNGKVRTEHYIDDIMYVYRASSGDSTWNGYHLRAGHYNRPDVIHPNFTYHPESSSGHVCW